MRIILQETFKKLLLMATVLTGSVFLLSCNNNDVNLSKDELESVNKILNTYVINTENGLTAYQLMTESMNDFEIVYEKINDETIEATSMGFVKKMGRWAHITYSVNLHNNTCSPKAFTGGVDWDYIIMNIDDIREIDH